MKLNDRAGRAAATVAFAVSLAACGGSSSSDEHAESHIETEGRLAITQDGSTAVRVYDLDSKSVAQTLTLTNPPYAIHASPGKRYAIALQRTQNLVQVINGGIWQEEHGDHFDDFKEAPKLSPFTITGPMPTHYEAHDEFAAIFMDGLGSAGQKAGVRLFSDESLGRGALEGSLDLPIDMHGTAEPRGNFLLTTYRAPATTGTSPTQVELYRRNGASFDFVRRFDETCPGLHGSYSNEDHAVFGCNDGVLVVTQQADAFSAKKVMNLPDAPPNVRISTIAGHHERANFVGISAPGYLVEIDPVAGTMRQINWAEGRTRRAHAFDAEGANFLVLDDIGVTHVLDATKAFAVRSAVPTISTMPAAAPFPSIAASGAAEKAYVTDPVGRSIAVIDVDRLEVSERLSLDFSPTGIAWLGIARHEH